MYDVLRADRCISVNSLEARVPFGDLDFVKYVMAVDPEMKLNKYGKGKYLLRHAFEGDYLPESILYREKAAFSDAVGHSMVDYLKEYAEVFYTDDEFEEKRIKYSHAVPFTKESWHGRMRACRGVGASLSETELASWHFQSVQKKEKRTE